MVMMGNRKPYLVRDRCSRLYSLHNPRGVPNGDTECGDIFCDDSTGSDCAPFSNDYSCQYSDSAPDPTITANQNLASKFPSVPTRLNARFVCGGEDAHIWPEQNPIADLYQGAVKDCGTADPTESVCPDYESGYFRLDSLKIGIEIIPDANIAAIIDIYRWLKVNIGSNRTKELAQDGFSVGSKFIWGHIIWYGGAIVLR